MPLLDSEADCGDNGWMPRTPTKTPLDRLAAAHDAEKRAAQNLLEAVETTRLQIVECIAAGISMPVIASVLGLSENGARSRVKANPTKPGAWPAASKRAADREAKRAQPRTRAMPPAPAGYARVRDLVELLGLTRAGVHYRINSGLLETVEVDGHRFVKLPSDVPAVADGS